LQPLRHSILLLIVCACTNVVRPSPASRGEPTPAAASATPNAQLVDAVTNALQRGDTREAAAVVERARQAPAHAQPRPDLLAYLGATVHAYHQDFRGAATVLHDHILRVGPTARAAFDFHNAMIALRTADGDLLGALVECDEMVRAGTVGGWTPSDMDRMTLVRLKELWHRAYLLRMIAQQRTGAEREAFLTYAERARAAYRDLAAPLGSLRDSIAVLDAYFAFCDGNRDAMREAALRVNTAENGDVEDLYLIQIALDGAGDRDAATALRTRILASAPTTVLTPVFLAWMRADDASEAQPRWFSPRYPTGRVRER
jgi:hypothetical protein